MPADRYGFDPFPSPTRFPGRDFIPGTFAHWTPSEQQWGEMKWHPVSQTNMPNKGLH